MEPIDPMEDFDKAKVVKMIREGAFYLLSAGIVFSLQLVVYTGEGWKQGVLWWLSSFAGIWGWLIAPYTAMVILLSKRTSNLRQETVHFFCAIGIVTFGILIFLDGFFLHSDQRNWILYLLVPIYQWIAIAGAVAMSYAIGKTLK